VNAGSSARIVTANIVAIGIDDATGVSD